MSSFTILSIFLGLALLYVLVTGWAPGSRRGGGGYTRARNPREYWTYVVMLIAGAGIFYFLSR
jgi:hypothetical protein